MAGGYDGLVAWITGGGSGIGRELALELARRGADVAVSGRRIDKLEAVVAEIHALGRRGLAVPCDVAVDLQVREAAAKVAAHFGRLDVAVANAGTGVAGRFEKLGDAEWRRQMDANLFGVVSTARWALPELRKCRGRLVLIGSVNGIIWLPGTAAYAASKFAVRAIGLTLAQELRGSGVSCTLIEPGFVRSDIVKVDNQGRFHADYRDPRPKALVWPTDRAARVMARAILRRKREFVFTAHGRLAAFVARHLGWLVHLVGARIPHR